MEVSDFLEKRRQKLDYRVYFCNSLSIILSSSALFRHVIAAEVSKRNPSGFILHFFGPV
jgi:hypothetical protein